MGELLARTGTRLQGGRPWPPRFDDLVASGQVVVGRHSVGKPQVLAYTNEPSRLIIGAFSSVGGTFLLGGDHHPEWISTFTFREVFSMPGAWEPTSRGDITLGNDVWTGIGATVLSGIHIGDGAVVGTGAVVTRDVRPYAVVTGVPAREVKRRFSDDIVAALQRISWWDWPLDDILTHVPLLRSTNVNEFVRRFDPSYCPAHDCD